MKGHSSENKPSEPPEWSTDPLDTLPDTSPENVAPLCDRFLDAGISYLQEPPLDLNEKINLLGKLGNMADTLAYATEKYGTGGGRDIRVFAGAPAAGLLSAAAAAVDALRDRILADWDRQAQSGDAPGPDEITCAEADRQFGVSKSTLTKAAKKCPDEPGYLPTRKIGRNRFVSRAVAKRFAENFDARREQRIVGSMSSGPPEVIAALKKLQRDGERRRRRNQK